MYSSHSLPIFEAELDYNYSEKGTASFGFSRGGFVSVENPTNPLTSDYLTLSIDQDLGTTGKLSTSLNSSYKLNSYENRENLEYKYLRFGLGVSYSFNEWMKTRISYDLEFFDSNQGDFDYNVNQLLLAISIGY